MNNIMFTINLVDPNISIIYFLLPPYNIIGYRAQVARSFTYLLILRAQCGFNWRTEFTRGLDISPLIGSLLQRKQDVDHYRLQTYFTFYHRSVHTKYFLRILEDWIHTGTCYFTSQRNSTPERGTKTGTTADSRLVLTFVWRVLTEHILRILEC